jgi:hypothetical protein
MRSLRTLSALAVAALCLTSAVRAAAVPEKLIPGSAEIVLTVNVKQIVGSDLVKKYAMDKIKEALKNPDVSKLTGALGIDPLKDIERITFAAKGDLQTSKKAVLILNGTFDEKKIADTATAAAKEGHFKYESSRVGTLTLHTITPNAGETGYVVFANKGTILASPSKDMVLAVAGEKAGKLDAKLAEALAKSTGKESVFGASVVTDEVKTLAKTNEGLKNLVDKLEYSTVSLTVSDGVSFNIAIQTADAETAAGLKLLVAGVGLPQAKKAIADNPLAPPVAKELIDKIVVKTEKSALVVGLDISAETIEKIIKEAGK